MSITLPKEVLTQATGLLGRLHEIAPNDALVLSKTISACLSHLAPDLEPPPAGTDDALAFDLLLRLLENRSGTGYGLRECRSWLSNDALKALQEECRKHRDQGLLIGNHYVKCGQVALEVTSSPRFISELTTCLKEVSGLDQVMLEELSYTYIHYDNPGDYCRLHIDRGDAFPFNCIICLRHERDPSSPSRSVLKLFLPDGEEATVTLEPGNMVVFAATRLPHCRTKLAAGESVTLLSVGIQLRR